MEPELGANWVSVDVALPEEAALYWVFFPKMCFICRYYTVHGKKGFFLAGATRNCDDTQVNATHWKNIELPSITPED